MKLCNETITVINSRTDPETGFDTYVPTVIAGVSWFSDVAATVDPSGGLTAANKCTIRIPEDADFSGKAYVDPVAYASGPPDGCFTLKNGDLVVKGAVADPGLRPADLQRQYETVTILAVTDNRRAPRAKHWKVVGA